MKNYVKIIFLIIILGLFGISCNKSNIHLASDAKTGEYIGVVITETRDFESKEVLSYEIGNGKEIFQKKSGEINIYEP